MIKTERRLICVLWVLISTFSCCMEILAAEPEKPSVVILMEPPRESLRTDYVDLWKLAVKTFEHTNQFRLIIPDSVNIFWKSPAEATSYATKINADFVLYMALSKDPNYYSYNAQLIKPSPWTPIAAYKYGWKADPATNEKAFLKLASDTIYNTSAKITVNITIVSKPTHSDVYRDEDRLGNTEENGFRCTRFWERGSYKIKVCKPGYKDNIDTLNVENNPTEYQREVILKKK
jgi:hypothetical protein